MILAVLALPALAGAPAQLLAPSPKAMSYEEETPPNLVRFELRKVEGVARDRMGNVIPTVGLGLFTDASPHRLVAMVITDDKGKFDFSDRVPDGDYRLVAKYPGLCTANIPLAVRHKAPNRHHLDLRMEYPGLGVCSYATAK